MGLVVGGVDQHGAAGLQAVPEGQRRVVQVAGGDAHPAGVEAALSEVVEADSSGELTQVEGEVLVAHLPAQDAPQALPGAAGGVDVPLAPRYAERGEEGEALDMVPVGVGEQQVAPGWRAAGAHQCLPKAVRPRVPQIQDEQRPVGGAGTSTQGVFPP